MKKLLTLIIVSAFILAVPVKQEAEAQRIKEHTPCVGSNQSATVRTINRGMYTDYNEELLAHLLMGEAGAEWCSDEMVYAVGSVVINRVNSDKFPNSIENVIFESGQYQCTWDGNFNKEPTERCYRIAKEILYGKTTLPENVVFQGEFVQGSGIYTQIQNMIFCYE